jgi:hypothetical protein
MVHEPRGQGGAGAVYIPPKDHEARSAFAKAAEAFKQLDVIDVEFGEADEIGVVTSNVLAAPCVRARSARRWLSTAAGSASELQQSHIGLARRVLDRRGRRLPT